MTAQEIADRLMNDPAKGITAVRIQKLRKLAERFHVPFEAVLACLAESIQQQINETQ